MPLFQEWPPNEHSLAAIWHIKEEEGFFITSNSTLEALELNHIKHPRRRIETLVGRFLLQYLKEDFPLHHIAPDKHDKPRLPANQYFFSISHSFPYVAAVISDKEECGLDLQIWKDGMEKIAHMFLSDDEKLLCAGDPCLLTLVWSAKEAAYKWNGRRGAEFIRDYPIHQIKFKSSIGIGPQKIEEFDISMDCFSVQIQPKTFLYKDFALALLIKERIHSNSLD